MYFNEQPELNMDLKPIIKKLNEDSMFDLKL